jgi:hypothetical protein
MKRWFPILAVLLTAAPAARAQVPQVLSYQGVLTDNAGAIVADGSYNFTFRIYDTQIGGSLQYQEVQNAVPVQRGTFSVVIGSITALTLAFDQPYWLEMQVGADPALVPRVQLTSAPYAFMAETVLDNAVTSAKILNNTILGLDVLDNTLTKADLADEPGTAYDLNTGSVTIPASFADVTVSSITLNAPAAGYIIVSISGTFSIGHSVGFTCTPRVSISESTAFDFSTMTLYEQPPNVDARTYKVPFARSQAYFKSGAGSYNFNLVANLFDNAGPPLNEDGCIIDRPEIHAIYLPTAYGTISAPNAPQYRHTGTPDGR